MDRAVETCFPFTIRAIKLSVARGIIMNNDAFLMS